MFDCLQLVKKEISLNVIFIRLDNSGETNLSIKWFKNQIITSNAPGTPQQNGKVERAFATLYGKTRSMLNSARLTTTFRQGLRASCTSLSVQLKNNIVNQKDEKSASEKVYGSNPKWISNMR
jgi:hypothetical protein